VLQLKHVLEEAGKFNIFVDLLASFAIHAFIIIMPLQVYVCFVYCTR